MSTKRLSTIVLSNGPDKSRDTSSAGQTVQKGDYLITYNDNGYMTKAVHTDYAKYQTSSGGTAGFSSGGVSKGSSGETSGIGAASALTMDRSTPEGEAGQAAYGSAGSSTSYIPADPTGVDNYHAKYTAKDGLGMTQSDLDLLASFGVNFNNATTQEERDYWHKQAELLRASYGYSDGVDGSQYNLFSQDINATRAAADSENYDLSGFLRGMNAAALEAELAGLKYTYQTGMNNYDAQQAQLPATYNAARNNVAAQNALGKQAFDERAAAAGLSSGAAAQAELSRNSTYQRDIAALDQAQADAFADIQLAKANLTAQYQNALVQARANSAAQLGSALYQEMLRVQTLQREDALLAAEREAEERALAMKLAAKGSSGSGSAKYNNGSLTAEQVKALQTYFGLNPNGYWTTDNKKATGYTADDAWEQYVTASQFLGNTKPENSSLDTISYYQDEGVFIWNGTAYTTLEKLVSAIKKAGLSQGKLASLQTVIQNFGFPEVKLTEGKTIGE